MKKLGQEASLFNSYSQPLAKSFFPKQMFIPKLARIVLIFVGLSFITPVVDPSIAFAKSKKDEEKARAKAKAEKEAKEKAEAKERAEAKAKKEAKEKAEAKKRAEAKAKKEAKEKAEAKERAEAQAKKESKEKAEEKARAQAKAEAEAREKAEEKARAAAKAAKEAQEKAEEKARAATKAEKEARKQAETVVRAAVPTGVCVNETALAGSLNDTGVCRDPKLFADSNVSECAKLSQQSYDGFGSLNSTYEYHGWKLQYQNGFLGSNLYDIKDSDTGFHGSVFKKENTAMIVFTGTDPHDFSGDVQTDWQHYWNKIPKQYHQAEELVKKVQEDFPDCDIILTGHSLGGSLAEHSAIYAKIDKTRGFSVITFNSAGINSSEYASSAHSQVDRKNVTNFFIEDNKDEQADFFFATSVHYGTQHALKIEVPSIPIQRPGGLIAARAEYFYFMHKMETVINALDN